MAQVITNGAVRDLVTYQELPPEEKPNFDYLDKWVQESDPRFVRAYGSWYDLGDAQVILVAPARDPFAVNVTADSPLAAWGLFAASSAWGGIVFRYPTEEQAEEKALVRWEHAIVGRYLA